MVNAVRLVIDDWSLMCCLCVSNCRVCSCFQQVELSGIESTVVGSDVRGCGCTAVTIAGGDAVALTPGNLTVANNTIHGFGRVSRTLRVGVNWRGCGNSVTGECSYEKSTRAFLDVYASLCAVQ